MRKAAVIGAIITTAVLGAVIVRSFQAPTIRPVDEPGLREHSGVYQRGPNAFVYLQTWTEFGGNQLVAFDESGDVRALYPTDRDHFFAGPGAAVSTAAESRIEFQRDPAGRITSLTYFTTIHEWLAKRIRGVRPSG